MIYLTEGTHFSQKEMKCLDFQSCIEAFLFPVGRFLYAVPCVYLYTNMDSTGKQNLLLSISCPVYFTSYLRREDDHWR